MVLVLVVFVKLMTLDARLAGRAIALIYDHVALVYV